MIYANASEMVAEIILSDKHKCKCGPDCVCWEIRRVPAINKEIGKLHLQKLQSKAQGLQECDERGTIGKI